MKFTPRSPDLTGQKFGHLTVTGPHPDRQPRPDRKMGRIQWVCQCDCGETTVATANNLRSGASDSCGCLKSERISDAKRTHGATGSPEYQCWVGIIKRCCSPGNNAYPDYGDRGIIVCDRWRHSFPNFLSDMGPRPSPAHSIDRIDNDGPYCPQNCQWATQAQQNRNQRRTRLITFGGLTLCLTEWSRHLGIDRRTLQGRLNRMTVEEAFAVPEESR